MQAVGISKHQTYKKHFDDLVSWGFFSIIQESKNQHTATIIALPKNGIAQGKALDKATRGHGSKQHEGTDTVNKLINQETKKQISKDISSSTTDDFETFEKTIPEEKTITTEKTFGNEEINKTLEFLKNAVGIKDFKESQKQQRQYAHHIVSLVKKIGKDQFVQNMHAVFSDDFKFKNCNSIAFIFREIKSAKVEKVVYEPTFTRPPPI
jgi:hypothetical protein